MKKIIFSLAAILAINTTSASVAGYYYAGVQFGHGTVEVNIPQINLSPSSALAYGFFAGYSLVINDQFLLGPELGFTGYPDQNSTANTVNYGVYGNSSFNISLATKYLIMPDGKLSLIGKAGIAMVSEHLDITSSTTGFSSYSGTSFLPMFTVGVGYDVANNLNISLIYNTTAGGSASLGTDSLGAVRGSAISPADVDSAMFAATYTFGKQ